MINDLYICRGFKPNRGEEKDRTERKKDGRRTEEKEARSVLCGSDNCICNKPELVQFTVREVSPSFLSQPLKGQENISPELFVISTQSTPHPFSNN